MDAGVTAPANNSRRAAIAVALLALVAVVAWWVAGGAGQRRAAPDSTRESAKANENAARLAPEDAAREGATAAPAAAGGAPRAEGESPAAAAEEQGEAAVDDPASESSADAEASAWANVDMDQVRKAMPDNLYFKMSVPTKDEAVLRQREEERERWNVEYGKVLSGTGSEEEVRDYYDLRARLATDYVEFATYLLDHYGDELPDRDVEMLKVARQMNLARLEEIPRKVEEALERKRQQDEARAAWLADQKEFEDGGGGDESD